MANDAMGDFSNRVGILGLGPIGRNFALNLASRGHAPAVFDREGGPTRALLEEMKQSESGDSLPRVHENPTTLIRSLSSPRILFLFVPAGAAVDAALKECAPLLTPGDILIDGGNSHHEDTNRRARELEASGLLFLGMGLSGGADGARKGPSLMPGGSRKAYDAAEPLLRQAAAKAREDEAPCLAFMGAGGAGHYVKMVHNGLEYADMQLIAEAYHLLRERAGLSDVRQSELFAAWNDTELESYLFEITAQVLAMADGEAPLLDGIQDRAGQKGTGRWTGTSALELAVAAPALTAAVDARILSSLKDERVRAGTRLAGPVAAGARGEEITRAMPGALLAARICILAQGLALLARARTELQYDFDLSAIARVWRAGCIIRSRLLTRIAFAFASDAGGPDNLLMDPDLGEMTQAKMPDLRLVLAEAVTGGVPAPVMSACLAYFDAYRTPRLPANLIQAQRDFFGAHGFERTDREGIFHLGD